MLQPLPACSLRMNRSRGAGAGKQGCAKRMYVATQSPAVSLPGKSMPAQQHCLQRQFRKRALRLVSNLFEKLESHSNRIGTPSVRHVHLQVNLLYDFRRSESPYKGRRSIRRGKYPILRGPCHSRRLIGQVHTTQNYETWQARFCTKQRAA